MKKRLTRMTFLTTIFALMLITLYSPISQITFSGVTITVMHIFVLIGIYFFDDWKEALLLGTFFGLISMMYAFQFPIATRVAFQNPLVSVLPRILFAMSAYGLYQLLKQFKMRMIVGIWAILSTIGHTFFVLSALMLTKGTPIPLPVLQGILTLNMIPEAILAGFVVSIVGFEVKKFIYKH